ncbi:MAG: hypothetical protein NTU74_01150 [Deltaproteobacteria bacterium]|nr:hypothetical protein [Deltaproteobacteria bacterium]
MRLISREDAKAGYDNSCLYGDKDGYVEFFNTTVKSANILVLAGSIKDRYLSSRWKLFFDRSFFNNHVPVMRGKQLGFIISGPLSQIPNLRQALEGYFEVQQAGIVDFVTDEFGDSAKIDALLLSLAQRLIRSANDGYAKPASFLGVGGKKVIRDIWSIAIPLPGGSQFLQEERVVRFPTERLQIPNYEFNDDAPEPNTVDKKGYLYQADKNGDDQAPAKSAGERMKETANDISFIHIFFQKMRLTDQQVPDTFLSGCSCHNLFMPGFAGDLRQLNIK